MPTTTAAPAELKLIPLAQIVPSPHQARKDFDEAALQGLADSMKTEGLIEPIVVRQRGEGGGEKRETSQGSAPFSTHHSPFYELISGERRWRAAKLLGWETIESKIVETVSAGDAAAKGMVENLQRQDLNPIEEAEGFDQLNKLDPKFWTQDKIAQIIGKDKTYVSRSKGLLNLANGIQDELRRRNLTREHGIEIARMTNPNQQQAVTKKVLDGGLTAKQTRELVNQMLHPVDASPTRSIAPLDPLAKAWESLMSNPTIPQGTWEVKHPADGQWIIALHTPGITPKADIVRWLKAALTALGESGPDISKNPAIQIEPNNTVTIKPEYAPQSDAELHQAEADIDNMRLPKNAAERAELLALAPQGPTAVYTWVFGPKSFYLKTVAGKTWKDLGYTDPDKAIMEMVEGMKKVKALE